MTLHGTWGRSSHPREVLLSIALLVTWGVGGGLVVGLTLVQVLGLLGLPVDTGTGCVLLRAFRP
jgi:hypothetical protein